MRLEMKVVMIVALMAAAAYPSAVGDDMQTSTGDASATTDEDFVGTWIDGKGRLMVGSVPLEHIETNPKLHPSPRRPRLWSSMRNLKSESSTRMDTGYLYTPTLARANGSNYFVATELWIPSDSLSDAPCSNADLIGCWLHQCSTLVCSNTSFVDLKTWLQKRKRLVSLAVNQTDVRCLPRHAFNGLNVSRIDLVDDSIAYVEDDAFIGIHELQYLSLERNHIETVQWASTFRGLDALIVLKLDHNHITNRTLVDFNDAMALPSLVHLSLAYNPLGSLEQHVFDSLAQSSITELNLQGCQLEFIHPGALEPLRRLSNLDLFDNPALMPRLENPPLPSGGSWSLPPTLTMLGLGLNKLRVLPELFLQAANRSLTGLNLAGNLLFQLHRNFFAVPLGNLAALSLESCGLVSIEAGTFDRFDRLVALYLGKNQLLEIGLDVLPRGLKLLSVNYNVVPAAARRARGVTEFRIRGTADRFDSLTWLNVNDLTPSLNTKDLAAMRGLRVLQMRDHGLVSASFPTLRNLTMLDLGENPNLAQLTTEFSQGLENLQYLWLDRCQIDFAETTQTSPFDHMASLTALYLTDNKIRSFPPRLLANNAKLWALDLSRNLMTTWPVQDNDSAPLPQMDLSLARNRITYLPNGFYDQFKHLWGLDLGDNAFICTCDLVKGLQMLAQNDTLQRWTDLNAYTCADAKDPSNVSIMQLETDVDDDVGCRFAAGVGDAPADNKTLSYLMGAAGGLVLVVGAAFGFRRRWNRNQAVTHRHAKYEDSESTSEETYQYDAFISYCNQDQAWVYTHLVPHLEGASSFQETGEDDSEKEKPAERFRLCLHDRDFPVGEFITENIASSISQSRKVVVVLSEAYCKSSWCLHELNLAYSRQARENRNTLVLVVLEDVPESLRTDCIRHLMRTQTYLTWSVDLQGQALFRRRLSAVLQATSDTSAAW